MNFVKKNVFNLFASILLMGLNVVISVLQSRYLGPTELGKYQLFVSTQTTIMTIMSLGIGQASIYYHNSLKYSLTIIVTSIFKVFVPVLFMVTLVNYLVFALFPTYYGVVDKCALIVYSLGGSFLLFVTTMRPLLLIKLEVVKNQIVNYSSYVFVFVAVVFYVIFSSKLSIDFLLVIAGTANIITSLILYIYIKQYLSIRLKVDYGLLKKIICYGMKLSANNIAVILVINAPVFVLKLLMEDGFYNIGIYSRASALCSLAVTIFSTIGPLLYSKWSSNTVGEIAQNVRIASHLFFGVNLVVSVVLFTFSPLIIKLLYGEEFMAASLILRILIFTVFFSGIKEINYNILVSVGKPHKILINLLITLVVLIISLFVFIPLFDLYGAAMAVLLASLISAFLLSRESKKIISIRYIDFFIINYLDVKYIMNKLIK